MLISDIIPYERNARDNADAVPAVAESIREFGLRGQITVEDAQKEAYRRSSMEFGSYYNAYLKNVASTNGVKLGNSKRTDAITSKLSKSGVSYLTKDEFGNLPASSVKEAYDITGYYY